MATTSRTKDYNLGKEKRSSGTSSLSNTHSNTSNSQRSTRQSTAIASTEKEKPEKHVPNYLKPTICSRNESFKLVKKNGQEDQKFLRRRSFDSRVASASASGRSQKSVLSPGRRESTGPVLREKKIMVRSTSSSARTSTSSKLVLDSRTSRTTKTAVKSQPVPSKSMKKTTNSNVNKKECNASPSMDDARSHDTMLTLEHEAKEEEKESVVHEVEEMVKVERDVDLHSDIPKSEYGDDIFDAVHRDTEVNNGDEDEETKSRDISTVSEHENVLQPAAQIEETVHDEHKSHEVNLVPQQESKETVTKLDETSNGAYPEETVAEETKTEVEDQKGEEDHVNATEELASTEEVRDDQKELQEKENPGEEVSEVLKAKEEKQEEGDGEKTKQESEPATVVSSSSKRQEQGQGKKESPAAYNDVIEETASKLLEKRKNKVKALVGAFETVIDYESSTSK